MKTKHLLSLAGAAVFSLAAQMAYAADIPVRVRQFEAPVAVYDWTGAYIGGFVGGAGISDVDVTEGVSRGGVFPVGTCYNAPRCVPYGRDLNNSVIGGVTLGYNLQFNQSPVVMGIEGEAGYLRLQRSFVDPNSIPVGSDTLNAAKIGDWYAVLAARFGYSWNRTLVYVKGGGAITDIKATVSDTCTLGPCSPGTIAASGSKTVSGFALGAGLEWAWTSNISVKAEYLFLGLNHFVLASCGAGGAAAAGSTFCWNHDFGGIHTAKVGLNYRFSAR